MNDSLFLLFTELLLSSFDDVLARLLLGSASLVALGGNTLARTGMATSLTAFTTTHGVINGVHYHTTVARTATQMTATASLTANLKVVLGVADDTDGCTACLENHAHFAARHLDDGVFIVARHQLGIGTSGADHLGTLTWTELDVVDKRTEGDFGKEKRVADFRGDASSGHDGLANLETLGAKDVTLLTVSIAYESDARTAVGVVLNGLYNGGDTIFATLEVDEAEKFLVATANVAHGHLALIVTATALADTKDKAFFWLACGYIVVGDNEFVALARSCRFNFL